MKITRQWTAVDKDNIEEKVVGNHKVTNNKSRLRIIPSIQAPMREGTYLYTISGLNLPFCELNYTVPQTLFFLGAYLFAVMLETRVHTSKCVLLEAVPVVEIDLCHLVVRVYVLLVVIPEVLHNNYSLYYHSLMF